MMQNAISDRSKEYLVLKTRAHVFGTDFEIRTALSPEDARVRFDERWEREIRPAMEQGDELAYEDARGLLSPNQAKYCNSSAKFRHFRVHGTLFLAQLVGEVESARNDQLWLIPTAGYDTRTLYVTFDKQGERDSWKDLATELGFTDEDLGKRILGAIMEALRKDEI